MKVKKKQNLTWNSGLVQNWKGVWQGSILSLCLFNSPKIVSWANFGRWWGTGKPWVHEVAESDSTEWLNTDMILNILFLELNQKSNFSTTVLIFRFNLLKTILFSSCGYVSVYKLYHSIYLNSIKERVYSRWFIQTSIK